MAPEAPAPARRLLARLKAVGRARVPLEGLLACFYAVHPEMRNEPEAGRVLLEHLRTLSDEGALRTPAGKRHWQPGPGTRLPLWVHIVRAPTSAPPPVPASSPSWVPQLAFAAGLRRRSDIETARAINDYLINRPENPVPVPSRERALEIFGDEKRLDGLASADGTLFSGRLSLNDLDCYAIAAPIPHERFPVARGAAVLVVENHHTYWSLVQANLLTPVYAAVCYGGGNRWSRASALGDAGAPSALDRILAECGSRTLLYFGDVDPSGLEIPCRVDTERQAAGLPGVAPEQSLYEALLRRGRSTPAKEHLTPGRTADLRARTLAWLGETLGDAAIETLTRGRRLPQEGLPYPQLCDLLSARRPPR